MNKKINHLKPHPQHSKIYYTPKNIRIEWADLFASMEDIGIKDAIHITSKNVIVSGHRRWMVAKELGWSDVRVEIIDEKKENIDSLIIQLNTNREKTQAEKINEVLFLLSIIKKRQGKNNLPDDEKGGRYEVIARKMGVGFSRENIAKIEKIQMNDKNPNQSLIDLLRKGASVNSVFKLMENNGNQNDDIEKIIQEENYTLINDDSKVALDEISEGYIDMCFSSYPYYKQRQYEVKNNGLVNWGEENTVEEYLNTSVEISKKIYRTLKDTGSFYLNLGDTVRNKQHLLIPEQLCFRILGLGFKLVNKIIWVKKNNKPMNFEKQLQPTYEHVFHFVKDVEKFKNRVLRFKTGEEIKVSGGVGDRRKCSDIEKKKKTIISPYSRFRNFIDENKHYRDIISSAVASSQQVKKITGIDHPAIFPDTLPLLSILQSTEVGDKVMDVCSGSGTLGICNLMGRKFIGIELSKKYHDGANNRLKYFNNIIDINEIQEFESLAMAA